MASVVIEGVIGAGKTTLARHLCQQTGWTLLPEPVDGNEVLDLFYQDAKRYAFTLQLSMLIARFRHHQVAGHSFTTCCSDRSLPGDRVFAKLHVKYGNISPVEWRVYEAAYRAMTAVQPPSLMIFLETRPEVALARIRERARSIETGVTLEYLRDLDAGYHELLDQIVDGNHAWSRGIRVQRVDWNAPVIDWDRDPRVRELVRRAKDVAEAVERPEAISP